MRQSIDDLQRRIEQLQSGKGSAIPSELTRLVRDIGEQHRREMEYIEHARSLLGFAIQGADVFLWEWDIAEQKFTWEPKSNTFLGYRYAETEESLDWVLSLAPPETRRRIMQLIEPENLRSNERFDMELQLYMRSGDLMWVEIRCAVSKRSASGEALILSGTARDIQRRHDAEALITLQRDAALRLSGLRTLENTLEELFDILIGFEGVDGGGCYLLSPEETGYDLVYSRNAPREFLDDVQHFSLDAPPMQALLELETGMLHMPQDISLEDTHRNKAGFRCGIVAPLRHQSKIIGFLTLASRTQDAFSNVVLNQIESLTVLVTNVIMRTITEKSLRESEEKYRTLTNNINAGIFRTTPGKHGAFIEVNDTFLKMYGFLSREQLKGLQVSSFYADPKERCKINELLLARGDLREYEVKVKRLDNSEFWAQLTAVAVRDENDSVKFFDGVILDITQQKRAAEGLRESEQKFRTISEQSLMAMIIVQDGCIRYGNKAFYEHSGYTPDEVAAWAPWELTRLLHKDYRSRMLTQAKKKLSGGQGVVSSYHFKGMRKNGEEKWMELFSGPISYKGRPALLVSIVDINEQVEAQQRLARSERRFRELFEKNNTMMCLIEKNNGRIVRVNRAMQKAYGYPFHQIEHMYLQDFTVRDDGSPTPRDTRVSQTDILHSRHRMHNGDIREMDIHSSEIDQDGQTMLFAILTDVTDRLRMEAEIAKRQKLEAIGLLAGGIAHDFNNILMAILGNISLLKHDLGDSIRDESYIHNAEKGVQRAKKLANQLLTFAKGGAPIREEASIRDLLIDSSKFMLRGSNIACRNDIPNDLFAVHIDTGQISQVVQNLLLNAQQAMPTGGAISITAQNETLVGAHSTGLPSGKYVRFSIRDDGAGISPENIKRVFDPYFSTRETGSGLGLSIVYSIVHRHGGAISLESQLDVGSTFHIWLPALAESHHKKPEAQQDTERGSGLVLFMDDEAMVRETAGEFLRYLGYDVTFASNGDQAIDKYRKSQETDQPIDVVVLDLTIPGGKGAVETMKELLQIDPRAKGIVVSGFAQNRIMHDYASGGFSGAISKPFVLSEFSQVVKRVMTEE